MRKDRTNGFFACWDYHLALELTRPSAGGRGPTSTRWGSEGHTSTAASSTTLGIISRSASFPGYHATVSRDFPDPVVGITHDIWGWVVQGGLDLSESGFASEEINRRRLTEA